MRAKWTGKDTAILLAILVLVGAAALVRSLLGSTARALAVVSLAIVLLIAARRLWENSEPGLRRRLNSNKPSRAITKLLKSGDSRAFELLFTAMHQHAYEGTRGWLAGHMGKLGDLRAVPPLIQSLKDRSAEVRAAAAESLGNLEDPRAVAPLVEALVDPELRVQSATAHALGRIGNKSACPSLTAVLRDPRCRARQAVAYALGSLACVEAVDPLISLLRSRDEYERSAAVTALGKLGDSRAIQPLMDQLTEDAQYEKVKEIPDTIASITGSDSAAYKKAYALATIRFHVEKLVVANAWERRKAVDGLDEANDPRALKPLAGALNDSDSEVHRAAAKALARRGESHAAFVRGALSESLRKGPPISERRWHLVEEFGKAGESGVRILIDLLRDGDKEVRHSAAYGLQFNSHSLIPEAAEALLGLLATEHDENERKNLARALEKYVYPAGVGRAFAVINGDIERIAARKSEKELSWQYPDTAKACLKFIEGTLRAIASSVVANDLRSVASLQPTPSFVFVYDMGPRCGTETNTVTLDCQQARQLARQELIRRGFQA